MNTILKISVFVALLSSYVSGSLMRVVNHADEAVVVSYHYEGAHEAQVVPLMDKRAYVDIPHWEALGSFTIRSLDKPSAPVANIMEYITNAKKRGDFREKGIQLTIQYYMEPISKKKVSRLTGLYAGLTPVDKATYKQPQSFWFNAFPWLVKEIATYGSEISPLQIFDVKDASEAQRKYDLNIAYWNAVKGTHDKQKMAQADEAIQLFNAALECIKSKKCDAFNRLVEKMQKDVTPEM